MQKLAASLAALLALTTAIAQAATGHDEVIGTAEGVALCQAAAQEGQLELVVEQLVGDRRLSYQQAADVLTIRCDQHSLLQQLVNQRQAENFEFVVIDLAVDVNSPLVAVEAGELSLLQYLMQQSIAAPSAESRQFALEYLEDLRSVDFNPNLQLLVMH